MKKFLLGLLLITAITSCTDYGKKHKVEGTKGEVYYKGEGVTEEDAKKTGEFLRKERFFNDGKGASVQISKEGDAYLMRFVYDKDVYDTLKNVDELFKLLANRASKNIFDGKKVNIALASRTFKDYKTIDFDPSVADIDEPGDDDKLLKSKSEYSHKFEEGVDFYWYGVADEEAKIFSDYVVSNGSFGGGTAELYMTMKDGRYIITFPTTREGLENTEAMVKVEEVANQIKDNVFQDAPYSFYATDVNGVIYKAFDF